MSDKNQRTAEDVMNKDVHAFEMQTTLKDVMEVLITKKISGAPVVDQTNTVLTVISEFDLMKFAAGGLLDKQIVEVIDKLPEKLVSVLKHTSLVDVFKIFLTNKVRRVVVTDNMGKLAGMISRHDILSMFYEEHNGKK